jgi:hypothetical protein
MKQLTLGRIADMRGDAGYAYLPAGQAETEFAKYKTRIKALERQCATLAAQVNRMRPVLAVAEVMADYGVSTARYNDLQTVVDCYRDAMARLAKEATTK